MNVWHIWGGGELVELIQLQAGQVLFEKGGELDYVYFRFTTIISLTDIMTGSESIEIVMVGFEGVVSVSIFMNSDTTST
jgi:hypothetical protein